MSIAVTKKPRTLVLTSGYIGAPGRLERRWRDLLGPDYDADLVRVEVPRSHPGQTLWRRLPGLLGAYRTALSAAFRWQRYDSIVAVTTPPFAALPITMRAGLRHERLVLVHHDIFPLNAEISRAIRNRLILRVTKALVCWSVRSAQEHVTLSEPMVATLRELLGKDASISIDESRRMAGIQPISPANSRWRRAQQLDRAFVVMYAGNFGRMYDFETVLAAARHLADTPEIVFVFVGDGYYRTLLEGAAATAPAGQIRVLRPEPESGLAELLSAGDVHVVPLKTGADAVMWPSKVEAIRAAGRPILTTGWILEDAMRCCNSAAELAAGIVAARQGLSAS